MGYDSKLIGAISSKSVDLQNSKYIGQGYVITYLLHSYLKDKFKHISFIERKDNNSKINFVIENEDNSLLGIHITINADSNKIMTFVKNKVDNQKALYLYINLNIHGNEKLDEYKLITNILENSHTAIINAFNDADDIIAFQVSPYGLQKQDLDEILKSLKEYRSNISKYNKQLSNIDSDPLEASIVRVKDKLIVVELEKGSTHIGVVDYDAINKEMITTEINSAITNQYGRLEKSIAVLVKMEPNKESGRPDMARIIALR